MMSRITKPHGRSRSPVVIECVNVLRDMLGAANRGELIAFYGVAQSGPRNAELIVAGDYNSADALDRINELKDWVIANADEDEL